VCVNLTHTRYTDVTLTLSKDDTTVRLMLPSDTEGTTNLGSLYCFTDSTTSSMPSTDSPIYLQDDAVIPGGDYKPIDALSAFDGKPMGGVWTLDVNDTRPSERWRDH